ncbi:MAG TPA: electron transfer flavoprotein subunit alpha/FixB family protein [Bellilinea sp.]|nr:electron transfer flavoprotein subunit alpha/FixB family protein [Bellilinea sp.]
MTRRFWVYIEQEECTAHPVSWELLGVVKRLAGEVKDEADAKGEDILVECVAIGHNVRCVAEEALKYGADHVYVIDSPIYEHYRNEAYCKALVSVAKKYQPEVLLLGATTMGRDLAGAVATSLNTGLTADCTKLEMGEARGAVGKQLLASRPAFSGNILATILCKDARPQMSSVRPRVFPMPPMVENPTGTIIEEPSPITEDDIGAKIEKIIPNVGESAKIEYADVIVAGGRGVGSQEGFNLLNELAEELGGVVGCTRPCVDAGWATYDRQVGQTGKTVRPKLYIAAGISGAIQQKVGMQDSDFILAINRDPKAPIFEIATMGIVGDLFEVVPAMIQEIRERKGSK